jgi:serine/threonine protein kinase
MSVEMLGKWIVGDTLGEGGFSQVKLGTHNTTNVQAALKILEKKSGDSVNSSERKQVESEIDAMKKIKHQNVIQMIDFNLDMTYRKKNVILVVLELASGGELFEYLSFTGAFEEPIARSYFHQLMEGLGAAHAQNICHRDLKPENLLMDENFVLKIADFGFAHVMKSNNLYTECGTTGYMAPEMFNSKKKGYNGFLSDIWACGVVLFIMIAGFPPYQKPARTDWWFDKLCKKKYDRFWMAHTRTAYFSEECKDLINKIFTVDPSNRITLDAILKHPWYNGTTISAKNLTKTLAARKQVVDMENNKLKVQRQQEQESGGFSAGTCRAVGDEGLTEEEAASDDLPDFSTPSIIMAANKDDVDEKDGGDDGGDQEHSDDEVVDLGDGGFDDGGLSMGVEEVSVEEKVAKVAPEYKPVKNSYTKFNCNASPDIILAALDKALESLCIETTTSDFSIACKVTQPSLTFVANVFRDPNNESGAIVECQRRKGDTADYGAFYAGVRNSMEKYAAKKTIPSTKEDTTTETTTEVTTSTDTTEVKGTD